MNEEGVSTESDSLGVVGAWVGSSNGSTSMLDIDGDLYFDDADESDRPQSLSLLTNHLLACRILLQWNRKFIPTSFLPAEK